MPKKNIGIVKSYGSIKLWSGDSRLSPASDIFFREHAAALKINDIVSFKIISHFQGEKIESWGVDNVTFVNLDDLPPEIILSRFNELSNENKLAAFEKYFDTLSVDRLAAYVADMENFLSPAEIFNAVADKKTFNEKFPLLVEKCSAQSSKFNDWAKIILANDFLSPEIILSRFNELSNENKLAAFEKYFDTLSDDRLAACVADMEKIFLPDEIFNAVADKKTFNEKFPLLIERSEKKFLWAQYSIDNPELFRQTKLCDDEMIFFMYEAVKRIAGNLNDVGKLVKLLQEKEADIESSPRMKIIYSYICAAFAKHYAKQREDAGDELSRDEYLSKHDKFMDEADESFTKIFNNLVQKIETQAENPDEKFFIPKHEAHVLPPCGNHIKKQICSFCEAVTWQSKECNYCPRLNSSDTYCFRINPNLDLPAEDWSVIELMKKLRLVPIKDRSEDHKFNREFFTKIGGEFNRLNDLLERLKCKKCGNYMRAVKKHAKWKTVQNLRKQKFHEHFAIFNSTVFSCQNKKCSEKGKKIYLSYCWHCHNPIDSRETKIKIKGYYLCMICGAGYRDYGDTPRYALVPGTICPNCGGKILNELTTNSESSYKKYVCASCNHRIEFNSETLERQLGEVYEPLPLKFL